MRRTVTALAFCLFASSLLAQQAPDRATLEKVLAAWATMDPARAGEFYSKDAGRLYFDIAPVKYDGWAAYEKGVRELFKTMKSISFKLNDDAQVHRAGNTAWGAATVATDVVNNDGSNMHLDARWTSIWEKHGGKWLIVHDHFSAPLPEPPPAPNKQ